MKGSSAMPHKRNPKVAERICGLARVVRAAALVGLENVPLWHERDISHSSAERIVLPDAFLALDYMLDRFAWIVEGLVVYPERMERNLWASHGLFFSHRLLLALVESGLERADATASSRRTRSAHGTRSATSPSSSVPTLRSRRTRRRFARSRLRPRRDRRQPRLRLRPPRPSRPEGGSCPCLTPLHVGSGKVRELYALDDDRLLLVASDRISTFDVVLPTEIPDKGRVLTGLSGFWFARTAAIVPNHLLELRDDGRSTECRRLEMLPIECVVRGYLAGSGWKDYRATGQVCGHALPAGPRRVAAAAGADLHPRDEGADRARREHRPGGRRRAGRRGALRRGRGDRARAVRIRLGVRRASAGSSSPTRSSSSASTREGRLVLGDEAFTPDSSRFWPADEYTPGGAPAVVRQAVRARLLRVARLGQDGPGPGAAGRRRRGHPRPLRRGVRAADRDRVRRLPRRPGVVLVEGDRARPAEAGHPRPAGAGRRELAPPPRLRVSEARVGRIVDVELATADPDEARAQLERMCEQLLANPLIESYAISLDEAGA